MKEPFTRFKRIKKRDWSRLRISFFVLPVNFRQMFVQIQNTSLRTALPCIYFSDPSGRGERRVFGDQSGEFRRVDLGDRHHTGNK
jgi:hypothetical protein